MMLDEDRHESLHGPEEGTVDHDRAMSCVVRADILETEPLRRLEVELDGGHLVRSTDRVSCLDRDLGAVEGATPLIEHERQAGSLGHLSQGVLGNLPLLVGPCRLARRLGGQLKVEVVESELSKQVEHEREDARELGLHLLWRTEDVGVVLGHAAHPGEAVHGARLLVAVDAAELEHPDRQLSIRALA